MGKKIEATKWLIWVIAVMLLLTIIGFGMQIVNKRVEREVLVNSHQYMEGKLDQISTLQAALAEINTRLMSTNINESTRNELQAQKATLNVQLHAAKRR